MRYEKRFHATSSARYAGQALQVEEQEAQGPDNSRLAFSLLPCIFIAFGTMQEMLLHITRQLVVTAICGGFSFYMSWLVYRGIKTGIMDYLRLPRRHCRRDKNPMGFWMLAALYSVFALLAVYRWWSAVLE